MLPVTKKNGTSSDLVPFLWSDRFDRDFFSSPKLEVFSQPAVNMRETEDKHIMELAAPGMKKSDFKVEVDNKHLIISAEVKKEGEENEKDYTRKEFSYASFSRSFTLPDTVDADKISATYKDGVLTVDIPKREDAKQKPARLVKIS